MRTVLRGVPLVALVGLFVLGACGGDDEMETVHDGVKVEREGEGVRIADAERGIQGRFGPGAELPDDFPSDVPLPDDVEVVGAMVSADDGALVSLRSDADPDAVLEHFRTALPGEGWSLGEETRIMGQHVLTAEKEGRSLAVQVMGREDGSQVMLHVRDREG